MVLPTDARPTTPPPVLPPVDPPAITRLKYVQGDVAEDEGKHKKRRVSLGPVDADIKQSSKPKVRAAVNESPMQCVCTVDDGTANSFPLSLHRLPCLISQDNH